MWRFGCGSLVFLLALVHVGCSGVSSSSKSVTPPALLITTSSISSATVGTLFSQTLTASNGTAPYSWSVASGQLPAGLALAASSGTLAGTPTQSGQFNFTVKVSDSSSAVQTATMAYSQAVSAVQLDTYGGLLSMPSSNAPTPTYWRVEKFGNKWMLVDPSNNGFYMIGMDLVDTPNSISSCTTGSDAELIAGKYGDACDIWLNYAPQLNRRLQAYGWNTIGPYGNSAWSWPGSTQPGWPGDHSQPVKMPFIFMPRAGLYSTYNPVGYSLGGELTLNFAWALTPTYLGNGYIAPTMPDWSSPYIDTWLDADIAHNPIYAPMKTSPYKNYLIGFFSDDSDQWYGLAIGNDFPAINGTTNTDEAWQVMASSPQLTGGYNLASHLWTLYTADTTNYMKKAWHDQLVAEYGTIAALNSAWGSSYTTFDSSGTQVTGESFGTGDGSTLSFTHTFAHPPTYSTIQILVNGTIVAGDLGAYANALAGAGRWFSGPNIDNTGCSINWATGVVTVAFTVGNAPANSSAITVNYVYGGWTSGTGLMDEDARVSHQGWTGKDWVNLTDVNANLKADLSTLKYNIVHSYLSNYRSHLQAQFPNSLFFGPDSMTTWGAMPPKEVLQAANGTVDAIELTVGVNSPPTMTQAKMNFLYTYYGDHPVLTGEFRHANPDSQLYAIPDQSDGVGFSTQKARGQDYYNETTQYISWAYPNGSRPFVGQLWWQLNDNTGESANWGILTFRDNLYNGTDAVVAAGTDRWGYPTGGEARDYGDLLDLVNQAHQYILANLPSKQ